MESVGGGKIAGEQSGCTDSEKQQPTVEDKLLNASAVRQVYLVTYSQANLELFPTRRSFAEAVVGSFQSSNTHVMHWVCSRERIETVVFAITWL